ncbi:MAPEG family protein [Caulobacter sp. NIBR2454]|uniref:MAPEG family protein n=1 Tax=Caulobacter sp. NIBR2454 TaxID=3015996 RepID=UPI0022B6CB55|nr:MAPEG family protein [Caulobacter sp. NIBR2454]
MNTMLAPVLALILWSLIVWLWMYATRLPAMTKAKVRPQDARHPGSLSVLPSNVRAVADNYNHLMEQPTIFYALAFCVQIAGHVDGVNLALAWSYVGLRVVHSLIQNTVNLVMLRFAAFSLATIVLAVAAVREALVLFV